MSKNNIAKRLFEGYDEAYTDPEFPNYGDLDELQATVEYSFNKCMLSEDSYDSDDERINDLELLADMNRTIVDQDDPMALTPEQRDLVYMVVYNSHIHPDMLTDTELANVIITLSNLAKLELREYDL